MSIKEVNATAFENVIQRQNVAQRIGFLEMSLPQLPTSMRPKVIDEINHLANEMQHLQEVIISDDTRMGNGKDLPADMQQLYYGKPYEINGRVNEAISMARKHTCNRDI